MSAPYSARTLLAVAVSIPSASFPSAVLIASASTGSAASSASASDESAAAIASACISSAAGIAEQRPNTASKANVIARYNLMLSQCGSVNVVYRDVTAAMKR